MPHLLRRLCIGCLDHEADVIAFDGQRPDEIMRQQVATVRQHDALQRIFDIGTGHGHGRSFRYTLTWQVLQWLQGGCPGRMPMQRAGGLILDHMVHVYAA